MKKISIIQGLLFCLLAMSFFSCLDETQPTKEATSDQLGASAKATEALLWAMPAFANNVDTQGSGASYDWGYGSMMHIRDVMTDDMAVVGSSYDWYSRWSQNVGLGDSYAATQFIWNFHYKFIQTANNVIRAVDEESAGTLQLGYLGVAYAFRALVYLDLAQMFEFLPNDAINSINASKNDVLNLTVPIVTETTTEVEARKNPRVSRQVMSEFILADLNKAEELLANYSRSKKNLPDLSVTYGLKARYYMWLGDYENAKIYARKAIDLGIYRPTTKDEWLNTTTGFNTLSNESWMLGSQYMKEDEAVQSGILNWTSWMAPEALFGYANAGPMPMINASLYAQISNDDFRKLSFIAPEGHELAGKTPLIDNDWLEASDVSDYVGVKFRPAEGNGDVSTTGAASAYPLMRIEEMYLIEAEAAAHSNAAEGKNLLEKFMQTYRYSSYKCLVTSSEDVVNEVFLQKRIEFWGEGIIYFDYKRLNKGVTRGYEGTNYPAPTRFNVKGRPAWMNFVIVKNEGNNNPAVIGFNNPDPSGVYTPWTN